MSDLIKTLKSSNTGDNVYPNITEDNIPSNAVKTDKINDGAVTTAKINDGAVTTAKIGDSAVTTAKIENEGVTSAKLGALSVTTAKIDGGAVTSAKIGDSAVTSTKINNGAVTYDKLATALKNLIDGKASQSDLETLQTAVQGKQDKIDSTHKLDADLVDDSTSTNKFVTTAEKTKISDSASVSGNNTFTGENNFTDELKLNGDYVATEDYVDTALSGFASLTDDNTFTSTNSFTYIELNNDITLENESNIVFTDSNYGANSLDDLIGGLQKHLYQHNVRIHNSTNNCTIVFNLLTNSATPFTITSLLTYLNSLNDGYISATGFIDSTSGDYDYNGIITEIFILDNYIEEIEYIYMDNGTPRYTGQGNEIINSSANINDLVISL